MDGSPADQMDPNQGNYAMMPYNMPMPSQSPSDNGSAVPASYVEIRPNVFTEPPSLNVMEMMPCTNAAMMPYPSQGIDFNFCGTFSPKTYYIQQVIILSSAVLTPPLPGELRSYRQKPDECHTVFVGGLPVKITEDIILEVFERYGEILDIRMNRGFCHVRFKNRNSVEQALLLSHYQIKIQNKDERAYNGKLHVDYAIERYDQYDFQYGKQRMKREEKHCTFSSSPLPPFLDHEAASVKEKLDSAETKSLGKPIKDLKKEIISFPSALIIKRVEEDMVLNLEERERESNMEEFCSKENSELQDLKEELDATNHKLKLTKKQLEDLEKTSSDEISKLKQALEECKKIEVLENYEINAHNTCNCEKFKEKASVIDSHTQHDSSSIYVTEHEICLVILVANYLRIFPAGATIYCICSFLAETYPGIYIRDIEIMLRRFPNMFREEPTDKIWRFIVYD
ncbi:ecto-NOX disulfide-thiol exchanger 1 [Trichonephila inaurata madagascariensis]|uniref:Ecto-NOX disulfide-thiol exchanger 1 n=1 Tax=Trichonephila inaurata madagascariensis TaxID=2747483 RepID=A0A8X6JX76_9ARAC|nr:ecto-NOX disulfide-thiol exchanger 1 [Trichonephila inaurata madagascariensis]